MAQDDTEKIKEFIEEMAEKATWPQSYFFKKYGETKARAMAVAYGADIQQRKHELAEIKACEQYHYAKELDKLKFKALEAINTILKDKGHKDYGSIAKWLLSDDTEYKMAKARALGERASESTRSNKPAPVFLIPSREDDPTEASS